LTPNPDVERWWARAQPFIEDALEHAEGTHTIGDVLERIASGHLQMWIGEKCAAVSEVLTFPRHRALNVFLAGGDHREMQALRPGVEAYARALGCRRVFYSGKATKAVQKATGWARLSADYHLTHVVFSRDLP
jgi:glycine/D-amino acid oxidase-like deaminating enzyme